MSRPIPDREAALLLLQQVEYNLRDLAPEEVARIRELLGLDDPRSIEQRVREGRV